MKVQSIKWLRREVKEVALRLNITYDVFSVTADGETMAVYVELHNQPSSCFKDVIASAIKRRFGSKCDNIDEMYKLFVKTYPKSRDDRVIQIY